MTATQSEPDTATASWPPGLPRSLEYPEVPVGSILRAAVRRWGDRPAFIDHDVPLTFEELGRRAHAVARGRGRGGAPPRPGAAPPRRRPRGRRRRPHPELPPVPADLLRDHAGRRHFL